MKTAHYKLKEERLLHFGQNDHVRIYSVEGLMQRLATVGFQTTKQTYKESMNHRNGFSSDETIIIAKKPV